MAVNLRRPILVGGVGLSLGLWLLDHVHESLMEVGEVTVLGMIAVSAGVWWVQQRLPKTSPLPLTPDPVDWETVEKAMNQTRAVMDQLQVEAAGCVNAQTQTRIATLQQQVAILTQERERQALNIAVIGGKGVGKTSLISLLQSQGMPQSSPPLNFIETIWEGIWKNPLENPLENSPKTEATSPSEFTSDLVLFVTAGDLTASEYQTLLKLTAAKQRFLLVWNKQDQYLPEQKSQVLQQLRQTLHGLLEPEDVITIACVPNPIKVRQHQADGSVLEWMEQPNSEIIALTDRLSQVLGQEQQRLIWATAMRHTLALKEQGQIVLNEVRRTRAIPMIEQYQWVAAGAAFANPVPALDLLAAAAINAQLVIDLGAIYQQKFSLEQGGKVAGTIASQMLKLGLVELSTQMLTSLLKSNAITFVAGGIVQGVSAAYLTRIAGLSLIEYFQTQDNLNSTPSNPLNLEAFAKTIQAVFQQNQRTAFLQSFVQQTVKRLVPDSAQPQLSSVEVV